MTQSFGRRSVLGAMLGIATGVGAGCVSQSSEGRPTTYTTDENRDCSPTPHSDGGPSPWYEPDSPDDVVISNGLRSAIDVTLTIDDDRRELSIAAQDYWRSGDVIADEERPTITVATKDRTARVQWKSERENMGIATFGFHEKYVDAGFMYKYCSQFEPPTD